MSHTQLNWFLATLTFAVWIGSSVFYFKGELKALFDRRKQRWLERRAARKT